ncbi:MAG: hypothetical protein KGS45_02295 [Planctomycetes bacterium]|nr:hypothetical protein [Planctomycetota bacterium]
MIAAACVVLALLAQAAPIETGSSTPPSPADSPFSELKSLDELLGLPSAGDVRGADAADLQQALSREQLDDLLAQAAELMNRSGDRLASAADAGLPTQRMHTEAITKLDQLIKEIENQQQQQSQPKPKPKPQQGQQQQQNQPNQQQQQQQVQVQQQGNQAATKDNPGPASQDGALNPVQTAGAANWGNLPPHLRDALRQGLSDKFSSMYQQLTEQYYKRLAEEPKK